MRFCLEKALRGLRARLKRCRWGTPVTGLPRLCVKSRSALICKWAATALNKSRRSSLICKIISSAGGSQSASTRSPVASERSQLRGRELNPGLLRDGQEY